MIGKKARPVIGNLITGKLGSGNKTGQLMDQVGTSPRTPLDFKIQSPRGLKNYDVGGVGLGIVAALEKSGNVAAAEIPAKNSFCSRSFNRSDPIPVSSRVTYSNRAVVENEMDNSLEEEYTYVTRHNPNKSSYTRVYRDGYEYCDKESRVSRKSNGGGCLFDISPARFGDFTAYPDTDFLSSCHLCKKKLHGKDIYMYRGEKAFCSKECRYRQIVKDEHKDKCSSEASRSAASSLDVSNSPCSNGQTFSTGILAI